MIALMAPVRLRVHAFLPAGDLHRKPPAAVRFPYPFAFFGANYTSVFMNNNGLLSFSRAVSTYIALPFPIGNSDIVAPL